MNKNVKKLGALALAGVIGFGATGNPVLAENKPGEGNTNVYYTSKSTNIDADGKIVMVIPADVNLTKETPSQQRELKIKTSDGSDFVNNFSVDVYVDSQNNGNLSDKDKSIQAPYTLTPPDGVVDLTGEAVLLNQFQYKPGLNGETLILMTVDVTNSVNTLESSAPGTQFSDVLTFTVSNLVGYDPITSS